MADGPRADDDHDQALAAAIRLHAAGDAAAALDLLPDLVAARPDDVEVRLLLARCLAAAGSPAVALAAADAAVACDPTSWEAHALVARVALPIDPDRAAAASDRAVQLAPHEARTFLADDAVTARTSSAPAEAPAHRPAGGLGAVLGLRPAPPATEPVVPEPRLVPRLPAALSGAPLPPAAASTIGPEPTAPAAAPAAPPAAPVAPPVGREPEPELAPELSAPGRAGDPPLPKALGGAGLPGAETGTDAARGDQVGGARLALRVVGLVGWLVLGFRLGVQGYGGALGIGAFVVIAVAVALMARRITRR